MALKILYISPENTVGTLTLWKKEHEARENKCRTVTFFKSPKNFEEDICLNLPFNFTGKKMARIRNFIYKKYRGDEGYFKSKDGYHPKWSTEGWFDYTFLKFKDLLWRPIVLKAIQDYNLYDFDVIHFESGMDFLKDEFFVKELKNKGKKIISHYHGEDLRTRGVMPVMDSLADLNLTNEVDLLNKHPNIHYLFLPYDTTQFPRKTTLNKKIRISHAPTNRFYKGSEIIINTCKKLKSEGLIEFDLIENVPHAQALERKIISDIFIDQIGDKGGWGYGMNSVESLSMGICTLTEMNDSYNSFIPNHPFISINKENIEFEIRTLIANKSKILDYGRESKKWVEKKHDIKQVSKTLYEYYRSIGL
ncbi:MAG: hypothetical protein ISR83_06215 [Candidatus Marinimicrobia bacterium]|nr:hypothetical protein [Candidatus Neomarinimicrobiota bacterium]